MEALLQRVVQAMAEADRHRDVLAEVRHEEYLRMMRQRPPMATPAGSTGAVSIPK